MFRKVGGNDELSFLKIEFGVWLSDDVRESGNVVFSLNWAFFRRRSVKMCLMSMRTPNVLHIEVSSLDIKESLCVIL